MKLNPFNKEEATISSLNEGRNMLFFCFLLVAPFYVVVGAAFIVDIMGLGTEFTIITLLMGMAGWVSLTALHWSNLKSALAELKLFGAIVRFNQTVAYQQDMLFDENNIAYVGTTTKGRDIYLVPFTEDYGYNHPIEGPISFNRAYIVLPFRNISWKETFAFKNKAQVWFRGLALTCSNSELAVFDVPKHWDWREGEWIPTFVTSDCWIRGVKAQAQMQKLVTQTIDYEFVNEKGKVEKKSITVEKIDDPVLANEIIETKIIEAKSELTGLRLKNARLTNQNDKLMDDQEDADKMAQQRLAGAKKRHRNIMNMKEPTNWRTINLKYFGYGLAALGVFAFLIWVLGG